jgi:hypothetical protein
MATAIRFSELRQAFPEGFTWPSRRQIEERVRLARRAMNDARHSAEDFAADATVTVRRHPLTSVAAAAGAGVLLGATFVGVIAAIRRMKTGPCGD